MPDQRRESAATETIHVISTAAAAREKAHTTGHDPPHAPSVYPRRPRWFHESCITSSTCGGSSSRTHARARGPRQQAPRARHRCYKLQNAAHTHTHTHTHTAHTHTHTHTQHSTHTHTHSTHRKPPQQYVTHIAARVRAVREAAVDRRRARRNPECGFIHLILPNSSRGARGARKTG